MVEAVRSARRTIAFENVVRHAGCVTRQFPEGFPANFDNRSFRLNDDANLNVHGRAVRLPRSQM